jgi:hypothetical protein
MTSFMAIKMITTAVSILLLTLGFWARLMGLIFFVSFSKSPCPIKHPGPKKHIPETHAPPEPDVFQRDFTYYLHPWPPGVNLSPRGEICPLGGMFTPSFTLRCEYSLLFTRMEG